MSACAIKVAGPHVMDKPRPCGAKATGYRYHEASQTLTPACDQHRTHTPWMVKVAS